MAVGVRVLGKEGPPNAGTRRASNGGDGFHI
jgi:hypothetical protein